MKILMTHRYFWPDASPYANILRSIGEGLAEHGHDVHVFASIPSYRASISAPSREVLGNLSVRRCWVFNENDRNPILRFANVFLYCFALFFAVLRTRPDVVSASTFPPVVAAWTASFSARIVGAKFVYHMQDIHPEVSAISGGRMGKGSVFRLLRWFDNQTLRRASAIVVLSHDMANTLADRNIGELPVHVINNFSLENFAPEEVSVEKRNQEEICAIFAGNLGRYQNLELLADGISNCFETHPNLRLLFLGDGAMSGALKYKWQHHPQVEFQPFLPFEQAREIISRADIGLVSLAPEMYRVAYPSKALTYLQMGLPLFALVETQSDLAKFITGEKVGAVPRYLTADAVGKELSVLINKLPVRADVRATYEAQLSRKMVIATWQKLLLSLR